MKKIIGNTILDVKEIDRVEIVKKTGSDEELIEMGLWHE